MGHATEIDLDALGRVGTALADETRRRLLVELLDGPAYPADLASHLGLTRSNVSNHLSCLKGCGLVTTTAEGRRARYELADPRLAHALQDLCSLSLGPGHDHGHDHDNDRRSGGQAPAPQRPVARPVARSGSPKRVAS